MKKKLLNSMRVLLVAAGLCVGQSVWSQTTVYERGTTNAWATTDVSETEWVAVDGNTGTTVTEGTSGSLAVVNNNSSSSSAASYVSKTISTTADKVLHVTATWNPGNATGNNNTNAYFQIGDIKCMYYGNGNNNANVQIGATTTTLNSGTGLREKDWTIDLYIDQSTSMVSYTIGLNGSTYSGHGTTATASGSFTSVTFGHGGKRSNWANTTTLKKISILEGEGYSYTINAVDGSDNVLQVFDAGARFTSETKTVYYPMAIQNGDAWYSTAIKNTEPYYGVVVSSTNNGTIKVTYKEDTDITYFVEGNDLNKSDNSAWAAGTGTPGRMSSGNASRLAANKYVYTDALEGGVYDISIRVRNQRGTSSTETFDALYLRDSEGTTTALEKNFAAWSNAELSVKTLTGIYIPDGYKFQISKGANNSNLEIDYLTFKKVYSFTEVVGATDKTSEAGTSSSNYTIKKGDTKVFTFRNYGSGVNGSDTYYSWHNWTLQVKEGETNKISARADFYDNVKTSQTDGVWNVMSTDGGSTTTALDWDKFKEDMSAATVVATLTYATDGTLTLNAVSTGDANSYIYYVNHSVTGVTANELTINFFVEYSWLGIVSEELTRVGVTLPSSNVYGTLASAYGLDFSSVDGLTAYVATATTTEAVTLTSVSELPANQGVILKGTKGATYSIPVKADAAYDGTNLLSAAVSATAIDANTAYILKDGLFHLVTAASTVPAGKAYLLATNVPSTARALAFAFGDDETTGISSVNRDAKSAEFYNLQGQHVDAPTKGLYIVNGKKVIIK